MNVWIPSLFDKTQGPDVHGNRNATNSYKANVEWISSDQTFQIEGNDKGHFPSPKVYFKQCTPMF